MAHEFESGFVVREQAWHGLATMLQDAPNTSEGLQQAGLDWQVVRCPVKAEYMDADGISLLDCPRSQAMVRSSDKRVLGNVGRIYKPLQNADAFKWFDPLIHEKTCQLESAGSLKGGRVVWILASITGSNFEVSKGDPVRGYLLLSNTHDGSRAVTVSFTPIRVVCWNTLSAAHAQGDKKKGSHQVILKHTSKVLESLNAVRDLLDFTGKTFSVTIQQLKAMKKKRMDVEGLDNYIRRVFTRDKLFAAAMEAQEELDLPKCRDEIVDLFENGPGVAQAGKTVYGAYQAITHYSDHKRSRSRETGLAATWFGRGRKIRNKAHKIALELCG